MTLAADTNDVVIAAIVATGSTLVGLVPLWLWVARNRRQRMNERKKEDEQRQADLLTAALERAEMRRLLQENHGLAKETYQAVNRVSEDEQVPDGDGGVRPTLGSVLRDVQREMRAGFQRNDEDLAAMSRVVDAHGEVLHAHAARLDTLHGDLQEMRETLVQHSRVYERIEGKVDELRSEREG